MDADTGLVRFGWRDYDPKVGRFTAPDPANDRRGDGDIYDYCVDDPVSRVDPTGLWTQDTFNESRVSRDEQGQFSSGGNTGGNVPELLGRPSGSRVMGRLIAATQATPAAGTEGRAAGTLPRGARNNNPGNIVDLGRLGPWQGQTARDGRFAVFGTPEEGLRALGVNTISHQRRHGANTIEEIIARHAPAYENNSRRYSQFVADELGVSPHDRINTQDASTLSRLMKAIIIYENGAATADRYTQQQLENAADAAIIHHQNR